MKTKLLTLFLAFAASIGTMYATIIEGKCGVNLSWSLDDETGVLIISGIGAMTDYKFEGAPWYGRRSSVERVEIQDGVTSIGNYAFYNCQNLVAIEIPKTLSQVGEEAAFTNTKIYKINFKGTLEEWCLKNWWPSDIVLDDIVHSHYYSLYINDYIVKEVAIPSSIKNIKGNAFVKCKSITHVTIPNSVTNIESYAFCECTGLEAITCETETPPNCGVSVFCEVDNSFPIYVPACSIDAYQAAKGWNEFTNIQAIDGTECISPPDTSGENITWDLTDGVLTISGTGGMYNYVEGEAPWYSYRDNITSVTIGTGVTSIGNQAFYGCSRVTSINVSSDNSYYSSVDGVLFDKDKKTLITYPCGKEGKYTIPNSVTSIVSSAFRDCKGLTTITIPNSVTSIGERAFLNCTSLTSITIPNTVTSVGSGAFRGCTGLVSVTIPSSVTSIFTGVFSGCTGLTSVEIPNSVTKIGSEAFKDCTSLTTITIPNGVKIIEDYTFWGCTGLNSINIPNNVTGIGIWAFYGCTGLTSVTMPNSVTSIGMEAFSGCTGLTSIAIPNKVTKIEAGIFYGCKSLSSVTIHNNIEIIGSSAFEGCSGLTSIIIPNSITNIGEGIGERAFYGCSSLTSITCEVKTPPTCGKNAFYWVKKSIPLYVPNGSITAYKAANVWKEFTNIQAAPVTFTIKFVDWDGTELQSSQVKKGEIPAYNGSIPIRPSDESYTYTFSGWTPDIVAATSHATYTATYESIKIALNFDNQITNDQLPITYKIIKDNQLFILRGDKTYTITGQQVK